jgi:hypothetical protein
MPTRGITDPGRLRKYFHGFDPRFVFFSFVFTDKSWRRQCYGGLKKAAFRGVNVIVAIFGDFHQFSPIMGEKLTVPKTNVMIINFA